ncbi:ABSCISIC ACID-INSENSITIVE 5-like protein 7 isoform X1 [Raphanus sativus]|uniref:ABSCISIC ACID-INSENSITIVE 5-like protein 7 isoform X1 n=1 Tax=Raphanus sativus TaxID=3726 RepID=A0A6J0P3H4_RAPSA|nr:ABSCISIC ACID-INSENSITIVE 5-like protein 7 isoform X1 [Raphanus sativus]XP_018491220.1 ABSCISIC ACID-INSENSITIVE 5-like protein 7 isoform X1 [Raphanus sativus]
MGTHINFNSIGGGGGGGERSNQMKPTDNAYPLARQYSLTFDELQSTLGGPGKDFGSMNMDELLKSIRTTDEAQAMTMNSSFSAAAAAAAASTAVAQPGGGGIALQRQGSLTLPRTISQKTVDEVWICLFNGTIQQQTQQQFQQQPQQQLQPRQQPHPQQHQHQRLPQTIFPKQTNLAFASNNNNSNNGLGSFGGGGVTVAAATSPRTSSKSLCYKCYK